MTIRLWRELFRDTWRLVRRHPWMANPYCLLVWRVVHTKQERDAFLANALRED